jgi:hypothetical protein
VLKRHRLTLSKDYSHFNTFSSEAVHRLTLSKDDSHFNTFNSEAVHRFQNDIYKISLVRCDGDVSGGPASSVIHPDDADRSCLYETFNFTVTADISNIT